MNGKGNGRGRLARLIGALGILFTHGKGLDELSKKVYLCCRYKRRYLMLTKVQKWGNSLALRIPKAFALDAQLENDSAVEISFVDGQIIIKPVSTPTWTLENMLAGVNSDNIHHETDTGDAVGKEVW